jgi:hypothetical protein
MAAANTSLYNMHAMNLMTTTRSPLVKTIPSNTPRRYFAGNLPEHIVLEMPNLSPTMEKGNIK